MTTDEAEDAGDFCVQRRDGCICLKATQPYSGDVQALLKEWDYKKYRMLSLRLARAWGCLVVLCESHAAEASVWDDYKGSP